MKSKSKKHVFMQNQEDINEQVLNCMDEIMESTKSYHIAIRFTALSRVMLDEQTILKRAYSFKEELIPRKKHTQPEDNNMVF